MVERETKQQILASIPPHWEENPVLFLTSPSGKYAAYFMRSQTAPGAGGLGADFCYDEVLDTTAPGAEGRSVWESECLAVSTVNTCALVFSWKGLEVFDGSNSVWHTHDTESDDNNFLKTLQLVDEGDMRILDKGGELAWKASDEPRAAQHCGMPGSPGLAPAMPPFAGPIGKGSSRLPFGQDEGGIDGNSYGSVGGVAQPELPLAPAPRKAPKKSISNRRAVAGRVRWCRWAGTGPGGRGADDWVWQPTIGGQQPIRQWCTEAWMQLARNRSCTGCQLCHCHGPRHL
uniref:non-specific serine/threonine protein kinase n=1 Tax=Aegilops tauschii subsp. strangulata TaxID=200361 RepID=A0A453IIJ6_AEGTS